MQGLSLSAVLDIAISSEEEAYELYMDIYHKIEDKHVKKTIAWIAAEEKKHKKFFVNYLDGKYETGALRTSDVIDHNIAEQQKKPEIDKDMSAKDVFLWAAHKELRSYNFYTALAEIHPEGETKTMIRKIAAEELRHKEKMEYLYATASFP